MSKSSPHKNEEENSILVDVLCHCMQLCECVYVFLAYLLHMLNKTATRLSLCLSLRHLGHFYSLDKCQTYESTLFDFSTCFVGFNIKFLHISVQLALI